MAEQTRGQTVLVGPKPNLLADIQYPRNIGIRVNEVEDRLDSLERFYGTIANHDSLDNLTNDDHKQYATGVSTTDRRAVASNTVKSVQGSTFSIGIGVPVKPNNTPPLAGDGFLRTDSPTVSNQRLYICTVGGNTPTWVGIL